MSIWAIADLHLAIGVPAKSMEVFGQAWSGYMERIKRQWEKWVEPEDLVLLPGDISWAMKEAEAKLDLAWIDQLPGTKLMIQGNHDYWWPSKAKLQKLLPPSLHAIRGEIFSWKGVLIGGTRLWDSPEYSFEAYITPCPPIEGKKVGEKEGDKPKESPLDTAHNEKIFLRELHKLELCLKEMGKKEGLRIVMTHYPPIGAQLQPSRVSQLLEQYQVDLALFGHLHQINPSLSLFGEARGVRYHLTAADYLAFRPLKVA